MGIGTSISLVLVSFILGMYIGAITSHHVIWSSLEKAGISRLIKHETVVDGVVTTNWVEIVWKDGNRR